MNNEDVLAPDNFSSQIDDENIWSMTTEMTPNTSLNIAPCLRARDYKDPPCVLAMIPSRMQMDWNDSGIMFTLRAVSYKDPPVVAYEDE